MCTAAAPDSAAATASASFERDAVGGFAAAPLRGETALERAATVRIASSPLLSVVQRTPLHACVPDHVSQMRRLSMI
jgi:hypothetical protein